jgi:hypothetical protein
MLAAAANIIVVVVVVVVVAAVTITIGVIPIAVVALAFILRHPLVLSLHWLVVACCFASFICIFATRISLADCCDCRALL